MLGAEKTDIGQYKKILNYDTIQQTIPNGQSNHLHRRCRKIRICIYCPIKIIYATDSRMECGVRSSKFEVRSSESVLYRVDSLRSCEANEEGEKQIMPQIHRFNFKIFCAYWCFGLLECIRNP